MTDITREQFASAVAAAIGGVHHLYREVDRLMVGLRESLAVEPSALIPVRGTFSKAGRDPGRLVIRHDYGLLFTPAPPGDAPNEDDEYDDADEVDDEAEEGDDDVVNESDGRKRGRRAAPEIAADQPLLAVRIALYDSGRSSAFEPQVEYAVMSDWAIGQPTNRQLGERFILQRYMLRRVPRALGMAGGVPKGGRLVTRSAARRVTGRKRGEDRRLTCRLPLGVETVPLYALDSAERLDELAERMKSMWTEATGAK